MWDMPFSGGLGFALSQNWAPLDNLSKAMGTELDRVVLICLEPIGFWSLAGHQMVWTVRSLGEGSTSEQVRSRPGEGWRNNPYM